jgi:predicted AlkP superfamily phosphohydrolase/phosphomutase
MVRFPGEPLDSWHTSFDKRMLEAETLWEAAGRGGKRVALINWPVTYPLGVENGVQIAAALNPPFRFFYMPLWDLASSSLFATEKFASNQVPGRAVVVKPTPARGWSNLPPSEKDPLEIEIVVPPAYIPGIPYYCLLLDTGGDGYDEVLIAPGKDAARAVARLKVGQQSEWVVNDFASDHPHLEEEEALNAASGGEEKRRGRFRFELIELSPDASKLKLYTSAINTEGVYTDPPELQKNLEPVAGPYLEVDDPWAYMDEWASFDWYLNQLTEHNRWWMNATCHVLANEEWDLAFSWVGTIDHLQHVIYGAVDPNSRHYEESKAPQYLEYLRRVYQEVDDGIGNIMETIDLEETLFLLISDHGFSGIDYNPYLKYILAEAGLLSFTLDPDSGGMIVDWSKTKCFPLEPSHAHIFVNLKGRDPHGIVEAEDYEKVQEEIIEALYTMRDPDTGDRVVAAAIRKEEAATLGIYPHAGYDRIGDVLFALKPQYMDNPFVYPASVEYFDGTRRRIANREQYEPVVLGRHFTGAHVALPADESMHATMILAGPGVRQFERKQPVNVIDIAPTLAYILGLPCPRDAEGNVLRGITED